MDVPVPPTHSSRGPKSSFEEAKEQYELLSYQEETKRLLALFRSEFDKLLPSEQFRLFVLGATAPDGEVKRDQFGNYITKAEAAHHIDIEPVEKDIKKPVPKLSARKLQQIGAAVLNGCHEPGVSITSKTNVLQLLINKVGDTTAAKCE